MTFDVGSPRSTAGLGSPLNLDDTMQEPIFLVEGRPASPDTSLNDQSLTKGMSLSEKSPSESASFYN